MFAAQVPVATCLCQNPGGVSSGLDFWLKANANVYNNGGTTLATNGQAVQQWNTQSGSNHFTQATSGNRPIYRTSRINGYPTLDFTGDMFLSAGSNVGVASNGSFSMFLVFKQNSYTLGGSNDGNGTFIIDRATEPNNLMSFKMVTGNHYNYQKRSDSGDNLGGPVSALTAPTGTFTLVDYYRTYNTEFGLYVDGRQDATDYTGVGDAITGNRVQLGRHAVNSNQGLNGEIAEVILYSNQVSTANRQKIDSYLALKYGITLDPTLMQDYYNSGGTIVYPSLSTAAYQTYRWDVAGIIQDNNSGLNQSTSRSQNTNYIVTVSNPSGLGNNEALVWGSNNGSLTTGNQTDVGGAIQRRLARVWRVFETGNVGTVTISFDLSAVPGSKTQADLRLLIDRDGDGFADNDVTPVTGTLSGGTLITFSNVNFTSGDYFTVGTTDKSNTPLPVQWASLDAEYAAPFVNISWQTASERNNSHFIIERSLDGTKFIPVGKVSGHDNSTEQLRYAFTDENPLEGRTYYRLQQVDFDGQSDYSKVVSIYIPQLSKSLIISPNPVVARTVNISSRSQELQVASIALMDMQGRTLDKQESLAVNPGGNSVSYPLPQMVGPGTYLLRISTGAIFETHKIVVEN